MSQRIVVDLAISADEYLAYYSGSVRQVVAKATDGRIVRFPAAILQRMVGHDGIYGRFAIEFDSAGKFTGISKLN
jgi:hypothetical protein